MNKHLAIIFVLLFAGVSLAQERIERAQSLSRRTANTVFRDQVKPNWLPDGKSFWYRVQTSPRSQEFVLINGETGERKTAATLEGLGLPKKDGDEKSPDLSGKV